MISIPGNHGNTFILHQISFGKLKWIQCSYRTVTKHAQIQIIHGKSVVKIATSSHRPVHLHQNSAGYLFTIFQLRISERYGLIFFLRRPINGGYLGFLLPYTTFYVFRLIKRHEVKTKVSTVLLLDFTNRSQLMLGDIWLITIRKTTSVRVMLRCHDIHVKKD